LSTQSRPVKKVGPLIKADVEAKKHRKKYMHSLNVSFNIKHMRICLFTDILM
jgi:hypothetical protein